MFSMGLRGEGKGSSTLLEGGNSCQRNIDKKKDSWMSPVQKKAKNEMGK